MHATSPPRNFRRAYNTNDCAAQGSHLQVLTVVPSRPGYSYTVVPPFPTRPRWLPLLPPAINLSLRWLTVAGSATSPLCGDPSRSAAAPSVQPMHGGGLPSVQLRPRPPPRTSHLLNGRCVYQDTPHRSRPAEAYPRLHGTLAFQSHPRPCPPTCLTDRKLSRPHSPSSRPKPLFLMPPQGACGGAHAPAAHVGHITRHCPRDWCR